jgi:4-aminobutyrate aminotransferase/(S)-3-amino-2-methylpropionate transaminase
LENYSVINDVLLGGGSTGKMWCHEHFEMEHGPDIVTFAKKMFTGGIYHNKEHRPKQAARIMNTWVGDPHKVLLLKEVKMVYTKSVVRCRRINFYL